MPQNNKIGWEPDQRVRDWLEFVKLTRDAAQSRPRPELIVWPETMFPSDGLNEEFRRDALRLLEERKLDPSRTPATAFIMPLLDLQTEISVPMLIGAEAVEGLTVTARADGSEHFTPGKRFNSTYLVEEGKVRPERYDKIELTPFGEVIPYVWRWPKVQKLIVDVGAGGMKFDLTPGTAPHVFSLELNGAGTAARMAGRAERDRQYLTFVTPICFEGTKSELCRRLVYEHGERKAGLIINVSNDGWFGASEGWRGFISGGRQQHLQAARWRCVELGVPMIRAVNTGISAYVDRTGKIRQAGPDGRDSAVNISGVMVVTAPVLDDIDGTVFGRIGNTFGWVMVALTALFPFVGMFAVRQRSNRPAAGA